MNKLIKLIESKTIVPEFTDESHSGFIKSPVDKVLNFDDILERYIPTKNERKKTSDLIFGIKDKDDKKEENDVKNNTEEENKNEDKKNDLQQEEENKKLLDKFNNKYKDGNQSKEEEDS